MIFSGFNFLLDPKLKTDEDSKWWKYLIYFYMRNYETFSNIYMIVVKILRKSSF